MLSSLSAYWVKAFMFMALYPVTYPETHRFTNNINEHGSEPVGPQYHLIQ